MVNSGLWITTLSLSFYSLFKIPWITRPNKIGMARKVSRPMRIKVVVCLVIKESMPNAKCVAASFRMARMLKVETRRKKAIVTEERTTIN